MLDSAYRRAYFAAPVALFFLLLAGCTNKDRLDWLTPESFASPDQVLTGVERLEDSLLVLCARQHEAEDESTRRFEAILQGIVALDERIVEAREAAARRPAQASCPPVHQTERVAVERDRAVLGRVEWVGLPSLGTYLKARIDTGANLASLSANEITYFERDGKEWIRFKLALVDEDVVIDEVRDRWIEARIERHVRIVQAAGSERRPVISLPLSLGPIEQRVEFTLNDRSHLTHPVLLGRRFLMDIALVDVSKRFAFPRPEFPGGRPAGDAHRDETEDPEL